MGDCYLWRVAVDLLEIQKWKAAPREDRKRRCI